MVLLELRARYRERLVEKGVKVTPFAAIGRVAGTGWENRTGGVDAAANIVGAGRLRDA